MHTYPNYQAPNRQSEVDLVKRNPFALLVSNGETRGDGLRDSAVAPTAPVATHVPMVFPPDTTVTDDLIGHRLWGHMGRKNPHWRRFEHSPIALAVFSTSHAYVSPSNYHFTPAAPTLNYAAVHLTGLVSVIDDEADSLQVVEQTIAALESSRHDQWSPEGSRHLFEKIIGGVVSFAFDVTSATSMFKLSQDMPSDVHERVAADLAQSSCPHADVADLMRKTGVHPSGKAESA